MSINVTVSGNPISIQKGRLVTVSPNHSKKEFEKRRLIRLSQVRQQSKDIAEDVRNRVRQEKLKQVEKIEREGQKKMKQWQARKLLELQNQYHEALKDIGAGHKEASLLEGEDDILKEKKKRANQAASQRGVIANKKIQDEKTQIEYSKTIAEQKKKLARNLGNQRSQMMTNVRNSSGSHVIKNDDRLSSDTEVSGIVTDSSSEIEDVTEVQTPKTDFKTTCSETNPSKNANHIKNLNSPPLVQSIGVQLVGEEKTNVETNEAATSTLLNDDDRLLKELREQKETRISDRIKRRSSHQMSQNNQLELDDGVQNCNEFKKNISETVSGNCRRDYQTLFPSVQQNVYSCSCNKISPFHCCACQGTQTHKVRISDINQIRCTEFTDEEDILRNEYPTRNTNIKTTLSKTNNISGIPSSPKRSRLQQCCSVVSMKPKVTLKSVPTSLKNTGYFLHNQAEPKTEKPKFISTQAEKMAQNDVMLCTESANERDLREQIRQRNNEAILRGKKALEREKLQIEYNELMKKLPILQKMEKLYEISQDKPEYHMSKERIREQEKKKQNILDNTYEKLFFDRQLPVVTLPSVDPYNLKEQNESSEAEPSTTLNLGASETSRKSKRLHREDEVLEIPSERRFRSDQLKLVLAKLRKQKEELLNEIQKLSDDPTDFTQLLTSPELTKKKTTSTNTSENNNKKEVSEKRKGTVKSVVKKMKSVKVGTDSLLVSSSYETVAEKIGTTSNIIKESKRTSENTSVDLISSSKPTSKIKRSARGSSKMKSPSKMARKHKKLDKTEFNSERPSKSNPMTVEELPEKESHIPNLDDSFPTVPANSLISVTDSNIKKGDETLHPSRPFTCDCDKGALIEKNAELCEIVIKIKDGKSSAVLFKEKGECGTIKSSTVNKTTDRNTRNTKSHEKPVEITNDDCCLSLSEEKYNSWHDKLYRNNSHVSNSSTSYLSPPCLPNQTEDKNRAPPYFCDLIGRKPQQGNLSDFNIASTTRTQSNLLEEIKKLLTMSRLSIDELGVSSVSTVTTPSQSIIDLESNKVYSSFHQFNTETQTSNQLDASSESQKQSGLTNFSLLTVSSATETILTNEMKSGNEQYPGVLTKYAQIADRCSQRISNLSAMIEQVRNEKNKMLQNASVVTTNDSSTRYMDLPSPPNANHSKEDENDNSCNLLDINMSLAEKLKKLSSSRVQESKINSDSLDISINDSKAEENLAKRFKALKEPLVTDDLHVSPNSNKPKHKEFSERVVIDFTPLLQDIPKVPPLTTDCSHTRRKKPPPSKGLLAARKLNEFAIPHELSTIPEQDSQIKFESTIKTKSPETPKQYSKKIGENTSKLENVVTLEATNTPLTPNVQKNKQSLNLVIDSNGEEKIKITAITDNILSSSVRTTQPSFLTVSDSVNISDNSASSSNTSGDEKVEMIRIEAMLRSIGMDWAISTLRKTQETLALTSSSSSLELKSPGTVKDFRESDIKGYLAKQMFQKISSSTLKSDASPGSLNESHEFSGIQDVAKKQTSTPVDRSKDFSQSHEKSWDLPSAIESEKGTREFFSLSGHSIQ